MLVRAIVAFLALPGVFAGIIPWVMSSVDPWRVNGWCLGIIILSAGLTVLLRCVYDFYAAGKGTLAPWSPPQHLVTVGLYRLTRNPMYLGVLMIIAGWAVINGSPLTGVYLVFAAIAFHLRVIMHEEKWLRENFTCEWKTYSVNVPRWLPGSGMGRK